MKPWCLWIDTISWVNLFAFHDCSFYQKTGNSAKRVFWMVIKPHQDEHKKVIEPIGFISEIVVHLFVPDVGRFIVSMGMNWVST